MPIPFNEMRYFHSAYVSEKELAKLATDETFKAQVQKKLASFNVVGEAKPETDISTRLFNEQDAELKLPILKEFMKAHQLDSRE